MNIKEVKDLIKEILQSDISEFELEHTGTKIKLRRGLGTGEGDAVAALQVTAGHGGAVAPSVSPVSGGTSMPASAGEKSTGEEGVHIITSPIVGTFYRAPSPEAEPYVRIGSKVEVGTILCIVEAMKLMNEIPSDVNGEIVEIYPENGQPVEFGHKLFGIRPRK